MLTAAVAVLLLNSLSVRTSSSLCPEDRRPPSEFSATLLVDERREGGEGGDEGRERGREGEKGGNSFLCIL